MSACSLCCKTHTWTDVAHVAWLRKCSTCGIYQPKDDRARAAAADPRETKD